MTLIFGMRGMRPRCSISEEALAESRLVGKVAAGDDDVLGNLPVELLDHLEGRGLLALQAIRVDGIEQIDGKTLDEVGKDTDAAVKVSLETGWVKAP